MALQLHFFMDPDDERELFGRLERLELELWPVLSDPGHTPPRVTAAAAAGLSDPGYYLAAGDVTGYPVKKGPDRGRWKIDEVISPVLFFSRSLPDEEGELRSGYFWAETEASGDQARLGGRSPRFLAVVREVQEHLKARYRKSKPVKGQIYYVGPSAARTGVVLREEGRKGELVTVFR